MAQNTLEIIIRVFKDEAQKSLQQFNAAFGETQKSLDNVRRSVQGFKEGLSVIRGTFGEFVSSANNAVISNQKLSAASRLTGASLDDLQRNAAQTREAYQLNITQANELTISLTKLGQKAGDVGQTATAIERLLDLAAAQGLDAEQALVAINQAILGIDEGTDKLFQKNPSAIYAEYAAQIGTTAGKLDDQQKAQALLNAVLTDGLKVQGEYQNFLKTAPGAQAQFNTVLEETQSILGTIINEVLTPFLGGLKAVLQIFQQAPAFIQGVTLAVIGLTTAFFALNISLGPITIALTALAALGLGVAASVQETEQETARLQEEMARNSSVMRIYQEGLAGIGEEAQTLSEDLNSINLNQLTQALEDSSESISQQLNSIESAGDAVMQRLDTQLAAFQESLREINSEATQLATVITVGPGLDIARQGIGEDEKANLRFSLERNLAQAESVKKLIELSRQLRINADDSQKINEIFREIGKTITQISQSPYFSNDRGVAAIVREVTELQRLYSETNSLQGQINEKNRQQRVESLNQRLSELEVQRIKLQLIEDEEVRLRQEFEIQRQSLDVKKQLAIESGKADEAGKIEQELLLLQQQFRAELEVLQVIRQRGIERERQQNLIGVDIQRLELQKQRAGLIENEISRLEEIFGIDTEIVNKRLELAQLTGAPGDVEKLRQEMSLLTDRLRIEKEIALVQEERRNSQEITAILERTSQETLNLQRQTEEIILSIEENRAIADAESEEERLRIRQEFALRRLEVERQGILQEISLQQQRVTAEIQANRQILESRLALANSAGDSRQAEIISKQLQELGEQETAAAGKFAEQKSQVDALYQQRRLALETQTNAAIVQDRQSLLDNMTTETEVFFRSLEAGYDTLWGTLADTSRSGSEKVQAAFQAIAQTFIAGLGEMLKEQIIISARSVAVHEAGEQAKTAATTRGVAARLASIVVGIAREIVEVIKSIGVFLAQAAAKLVAFFAGLGPIGFVAGLAAIPALIAAAKAVIKNVGKFQSGGILREPTLGLLAEGGSPEAAIPLNQQGAEFIARLLPKIVIGYPQFMGANMKDLVDTIAMAVQNVKIEIRNELGDIIKFYRQTWPIFEKNESRRRLV